MHSPDCPCQVAPLRGTARCWLASSVSCHDRLMPSEPIRRRSVGEPIGCPRCGRAIVLLVGVLGPCEICEGELKAERAARREARATPRPCAENCGRTVTGSATY